MTPRPKQKDREHIIQETRGTILTAAAEEFAQYGYEGANVNRIARSAGYAIGTIYNHFPSKRALMEAFIDEVGGRHVDYIIEVVMGKDGPIERVKAFFQAGFDFVTQNLAQSRSIFNTLHGPDMGFRQRLFQIYTPLFAFVQEELLDRGTADGTFSREIPTSTAGLIMLIYLGVGSQFTAGRTHRVNAQDVADFVNRALVVGYFDGKKI